MPHNHKRAAWVAGCLLLVLAGCATPPPLPLPVPTAALPCPQWTDFPADPHSNADSPWLGCTTALNLRAMVANPADLDHGRPLGPADGELMGLDVDYYREGKPKPPSTTVLQQSTTTGVGGSSGGSQ